METLLQRTSGIIYVIDSSDKERIAEAKQELYNLMEEEKLKDIKILISANKQDMPGMTVAEIKCQLELENIKSHQWNIVGTCAITGDGLLEGLNWLINAITNPN